MSNEVVISNELLPTPPTPATALRRAVAELKEDRRLVRPLRQSGGATGWAIVHERQDGQDLAHSVELRVQLDNVGRPQCTPADHTDAARIKRAYATYLESLEAADNVCPCDGGPYSRPRAARYPNPP